MLFTEAITFNGKHSYYDMGLAIKSIKGDVPKIKSVTTTVPYMKGEYNYTYACGSPGYDAKKLAITFIYEGKNPEELEAKKDDVIEWLTSQQGGELRRDSIKDKHYKDVYATITEFNNSLGGKKATISVNFSCYPLMISDYTRPRYYTSTAILTAFEYELTLDKATPSFSCDTAVKILWDGEYYDIPANSKQYKLTDIVFERGVNEFSLIGASNVTIECIKETL